MIDIMTRLSRVSSRAWGAIALSMVALISVADYLTGTALAFSIFYLVPISMVTWFIGKRGGIVSAAGCAAVWLVTVAANVSAYSNTLLPIWNFILGVSLFGTVLVIISALHDALEHERDLARTDSLTGVANSRALAELAQFELKRLSRYGRPFSLAYIDLDNFKTINDRFGHGAGDALLRTVAETIKGSVRPTDTVARLGGDEFAILFVEADYKAAQVAIRRVQNALAANAKGTAPISLVPITFSIGVITCEDPSESLDELLNMADTLMYKVKRASKNGIRHELLGKESQVA
jgi:diguanylate cyclase (GGDEF)-like protein